MPRDKIADSELRVLEILWEKGPLTAKDVSDIAADTIGWNKNTTYTILTKLVDKDVVRRSEPGFLCTPLIRKEDVRKAETQRLIDKLYSGSKKAFFAAFLADGITEEERAALRDLIEKR